MKLLICKKCGNMVELIAKGTCPVKCCGEPLEELVPNTTDAANEKHVPVVEQNGCEITVKVGEVAHPMMEKHYITFIAVETNKGVMRKDLKPGEEPIAKFVLAEGEEYVAAYEYCNLHGLWKA